MNTALRDYEWINSHSIDNETSGRFPLETVKDVEALEEELKDAELSKKIVRIAIFGFIALSYIHKNVMNNVLFL